MYLCDVTKVNLTEREIDTSPFNNDGTPFINYPRSMELTLVKECSIPIELLKSYGVKGNIQSPRRLSGEVLRLLKETNLQSMEQNINNSPRCGFVINDLPEGKKIGFFTTRYERNPQNREIAIKIHGTKCMACGFDFSKFYGERGKDFIEVHHTKPLFQSGQHKINPETDLICLCSNCHSMIHRVKDHVLTLNELKKIIDDNRH